MCACEPESYPSDLTDAQWELIAPMVEPRPGGRPATHPRRRIVDAILYLNRTGCSWRRQDFDAIAALIAGGEDLSGMALDAITIDTLRSQIPRETRPHRSAAKPVGARKYPAPVHPRHIR